MELNLTDLLPIKEWMAFERELHASSGLDVNVFNTKGIRITGYKEWVNGLCPVIKAHDKGQAFICAVAHMNIAAQAKGAKKPVIEECDGGLLKMVVPIFVKREFLGTVGACGLLLDDGEVDSFMINKTIDIEVSEIEKLAEDIKSVSTREMELLGEHISGQLKKIGEDFESRTI
jgi:ligand-binding sensor protein